MLFLPGTKAVLISGLDYSSRLPKNLALIQFFFFYQHKSQTDLFNNVSEVISGLYSRPSSVLLSVTVKAKVFTVEAKACVICILTPHTSIQPLLIQL